jgi:regulator of RNase E activity RraB
MMNESSVEATLETPVSGVQESVPAADVSADRPDITWWGDQSDMPVAAEAAVENNAGIQSDVSNATGQETGVSGESAGLESTQAASALEVGYTAGDFDNLLETIGSSHDFKDGPTMWNHLLGIMDEMSFENKQKYFEGLVADDALGVPVEQAHYSWLEQNMSETAPPWMDMSGPDRLTPEQWEYAGVPTGDPRDLTGAVLDHSKLFDVLFNKEFDVSEALNESFDAVGSEASEASPEITAAEPIIYESGDTLETTETVLPERVSAESIEEVRSQLLEINEKFANPSPDGTVSTNARELAIRAWDGGDFTLDTAPATTGDGANDGMLNSFRKSIAEGSSGGQEFFGSTLKKEIWVQPDGSVQEIHFKPGGGVSFAGY